MSKGYDAPMEVRELEKQINDFTNRYGLDVRTVFQDLLRYIINGFSIPGSPKLSNWNYSKVQSAEFYHMYATWVGIMARQTADEGKTFDAFGDLFMALTSQRGQQQKGQFFTPDSVTQLCRELMMTDTDKPCSVHDPAVGSGRMLIAAKEKNPRSYLVGWDIDYTCCLMCVCNILVNSCVGEVVCMDSLSTDKFRGAWLINESLWRTGLPSIRWMNEEEYKNFKRSDIPAYVFFLDKEHYDEYFKMRKFIANMQSLLNPNQNQEAV